MIGGSTGQFKVALQVDTAYDGPVHIFAESRRKMFDDEQVSPHQCIEFLVDVRDPEGEPLQAREPGPTGLNLRFEQGGNWLTALSVQPAIDPTVIFIAGDSTVADQSPQWQFAPNERYTGWGQLLPALFDDNILVANYADSGEGTAAFRIDGGAIWWQIENRMQAGDWLFIQLGHNDKTTAPDVYRSRLLGMIQAAKAKGVHPLLITPMVRNNGSALEWQHIYGDLNVRNEMIGLATSENIPLIDLMKTSSEWVNQLGRTTAQTYFVNSDQTHTNELGATVFAQFVAVGISGSQLTLSENLRY